MHNSKDRSPKSRNHKPGNASSILFLLPCFARNGYKNVRWLTATLAMLFVLGTTLLFGGGIAFAAASPLILQASPSSLNGNTNCSYTFAQGWTCTVTLSRGDTIQKNLTWKATGASGITFTPSSGILTPGGTASVSIALPNSICPSRTTLVFKGPNNSVRVPWSCAGPTMTLDTNSFTAGQNCPSATGGWTCAANLGETASSQGNLNWTAKSVLKGVTFTPAKGTLTPGGSAPISIFVPTSACKNGTFTFVGVKSMTIPAPWNCVKSKPAPTLTVNPASLDATSSSCAVNGVIYTCTVSVGETASSQGVANWTVSSSLSGVSFNPSGSQLTPGASKSVIIGSIPCQNGAFTFTGLEGETPVVVPWSCTPPPPTLTISPASLDPSNSKCFLEPSPPATVVLYFCSVTLSETSTSVGQANWSTGIPLPGSLIIPNSGTLSPGGSVTISIQFIPCQIGTFTFSGAEGETPVTLPWNCIPSATFSASATNLDPTQCALGTIPNQGERPFCTIGLANSSTSTEIAHWTVNSNLPDVVYVPKQGQLYPGQGVQISIIGIPCQNGTITITGAEGETPITIPWSCTIPALNVTPSSLPNTTVCTGGTILTPYQCTLSISAVGNGPGYANWTVSTNLSNVTFSSQSGALLTGAAPTQITATIPCLQLGSGLNITFAGLEGEASVVIPWTSALCSANGKGSGSTTQHPVPVGLIHISRFRL